VWWGGGATTQGWVIVVARFESGADTRVGSKLAVNLQTPIPQAPNRSHELKTTPSQTHLMKPTLNPKP